MLKQPPPAAPTGSARGPCPTIIQIVGRPGTGSLPRTNAPPDPSRDKRGIEDNSEIYFYFSKKTCRTPSLESTRDGSYKGSKSKICFDGEILLSI